MTPSHLHRPTEQTFAVHQEEVETYAEDDGDLEVVFAVGDPPVTIGYPRNRPPTDVRLGTSYGIRDAPDPQTNGRPPPPDHLKEIDRSQIRIVVSALRHGPVGSRDYSRIKCFSCGQFGHMHTRCPRPDASLPIMPVGWQLPSDYRQQRDGDSQQGNSP